MCLEKKVCKFRGEMIFQSKNYKIIKTEEFKKLYSKRNLDSIITITTSYHLRQQIVIETRLKNFQNNGKQYRNT